MTTDGFYLGGILDEAGERTSDRVDYDPGDLTTHGVIVGMTGSGKTGLGVIYLEEALLAGIPALILDPKGDMTNLLLTFPELRPDDFAPWIDESAARSAGVSVAEMAASTADRWRKGLADWDQDGDRIRQLKDGAWSGSTPIRCLPASTSCSPTWSSTPGGTAAPSTSPPCSAGCRSPRSASSGSSTSTPSSPRTTAPTSP